MRAGVVVVLACAACGRDGFTPLGCDASSGSAGAAMFVQSNAMTTNQNTAFPYTLPQTAGNTNLVVVATDQTILALFDDVGNAYAIAIGPTNIGNDTQTIYYARAIRAAGAGANQVHVNFGNVGAMYISIVEYAGIDPVPAIDAVGGAFGAVGELDSGSFATTHAHDVVVAAGFTAGTSLATAGPGFTSRILSSNTIVEDMQLGAAGSYDAKAEQTTGSNWIMQAVAFVTR